MEQKEYNLRSLQKKSMSKESPPKAPSEGSTIPAINEGFNILPLLGDYSSKTIRDYDILMPDLLHIKGYNAAKRSVFIIMEDGKIGYKWVSEDPLKEPNYEEIKNFLK